ncbi:glycerol kinase [Bacillus tequilensis]|nr:glycerol kinase [Bacillus tequilensis]
MQFQGDILDVPVERPEINETTALGAAYLAGIAVGFWKDRSEIANQWNLDKRFEPELEEKRHELYTGWQKAVKAAMAFK